MGQFTVFMPKMAMAKEKVTGPVEAEPLAPFLLKKIAYPCVFNAYFLGHFKPCSNNHPCQGTAGLTISFPGITLFTSQRGWETSLEAF
jgi:hypothetical protein